MARHILHSQQLLKTGHGSPSAPRRAVPEAKPATPEGGANDPKQAQAPIGIIRTSLTPRQPQACAEQWRQVIVSKLEAGLTAQRIYQDLVQANGFVGESTPACARFVRRLRAQAVAAVPADGMRAG